MSSTLPDGETLTTSYGADGRPVSLSSSLGGSPSYAANAVYTPLGQLTQLDLGGSSGSSGSGRLSHRSYGLGGVPSTGGLFGALKTTQWPAASPTLVNRTLGYDPVGNVTSLADGVAGETLSSTYDALDRLINVSAPIGESSSYTPDGNLLSKDGQAQDYQDAAHAHAVSSVGAAGPSYGYDANGSVTSTTVGGVTTSFSYDPQRRPVRVSQGTATLPSSTLARFAYDGDGVRRKRLDANGVVHYVSGGYEVDKGNGLSRTSDTVTKLYGFAGRLIAVRKGGVLSYLGTDHLGSPIQVTDSSFGALSQGQQRYTPFGTSRDSGAGIPTDHLFTSQIRDASIGLYWYASRAYDPALGRFCQPDSIVPSPGDPQSLNRYSYVRNNPLGRIDPSGRTDVDVSTYAGRQAFREANPGMDWATWNDRIGRGFSLTDATGAAYTPENYTPGSPQWQAASPGGSGDEGEQRAAQVPPSQTVPPDKSLAIWHEPDADSLRDSGQSYSYFVTWYGGPVVRVINRASGIDGAPFSGIAERVGFNPQAIVLDSATIRARGEIRPGTEVLRHELGHVLQAREMGAGYLPAYFQGLASLAVRRTDLGLGPTDDVSRLHPMEIDANRRAGLAPLWGFVRS